MYSKEIIQSLSILKIHIMKKKLKVNVILKKNTPHDSINVKNYKKETKHNQHNNAKVTLKLN